MAASLVIFADRPVKMNLPQVMVKERFELRISYKLFSDMTDRMSYATGPNFSELIGKFY